MKKLYKLLSLVTALAMLLCSAALAEGADMTLYSATLSDIQMTVDGTPIVDLSGLSVSGGIAMDLAADRVVLQSAVLAGDQAALSANMAYGSGKAVVNVDGLSQPLVVNGVAGMEEQTLVEALINSIVSSMSPDEKAALDELIIAVQDAGSASNVAGMTTALDDFSNWIGETLTGDVSDAGATSHAFMDGTELNSAHLQLSISGDQLREMMGRAYGVYDANPALFRAFVAFLKFAGEDIGASSFTEYAVNQGILGTFGRISVSGDIYVSDDGNYLDAPLVLTADDGSSIRLNVASIATDASVRLVVDLLPDDDSGEAITLDCTFGEDPTGMPTADVLLNVNVAGESDSLSISAAPDEQYGYLVALNVTADGENVGMALAVHDEHVIFTVYDDTESIEVGYTTNYEGAQAGEGLLYATYNDGTTEYNFSATMTTNVSVVTAPEVEAMLSATGIDVINMSAEDEQALEGELETLLIGAVGKLVGNVPGLASLMTLE